MELTLITIGVSILLLLVYLNTVTTVIVFKVPDSVLVFNIFRSAFVWLVPVIGFATMLRFTQQSFDCDLHYKLIPKLLQNWIYDDQFRPANPNADRREGLARKLAASDRIDQLRRKL